jgi:hypothetical protein
MQSFRVLERYHQCSHRSRIDRRRGKNKEVNAHPARIVAIHRGGNIPDIGLFANAPVECCLAVLKNGCNTALADSAFGGYRIIFFTHTFAFSDEHGLLQVRNFAAKKRAYRENSPPSQAHHAHQSRIFNFSLHLRTKIVSDEPNIDVAAKECARRWQDEWDLRELMGKFSFGNLGL